jgi:aspartate ammonia-lyase
MRFEKDLLGELKLPDDALYGINALRSMQNFKVSSRLVNIELIKAFGIVKLACARTNHALGYIPDTIYQAVFDACIELAEGKHYQQFALDALQGGAGTSTNMTANEVIANRALQIMGLPLGSYEVINPHDHINLHQSTNDVYPTALRLAAIRLIGRLEESIVKLQEAFQELEKKFAGVVKVGRTEMMDAVLTTLGKEMSAYSEALGRDRWRIYKCEERLRVVNLGGTAIGTGLSAPKQYIFRVVDALRDATGIGFARSENMVETTQNADVFVEISGIVCAHATTLFKIANDLRFMSSGPSAGIGEIRLPEVQAGSSIMPGKVNPVIPESVMQCAMLAFGFDSVIKNACSMGNLELNPFMPLVAFSLLEMIEVLTGANTIFFEKCVAGIQANEQVCRQHAESSTAALTALVPIIGYERSQELAVLIRQTGKTLRQAVLENIVMSEKEFDEAISPESVMRLGF